MAVAVFRFLILTVSNSEDYCYCDIYRVDGDEFVVIANGKEVSNMDRMISELRKLNESDRGEQPWEYVSAAVGYSIFDFDTDNSVKEVYIRADEQMYENKAEMKTVTNLSLFVST